MLVIGLTGGIGTGKSTVAQRFAAHGVPVIDADVIARQLVEPGQSAYNKIVALFGPSILKPDKNIDRAILRELIFSDAEKRTQLEGILHPLVRSEMRQAISKLQSKYCILMIPLLIESGQMDMVDRILLIRSDQALQVQRASERDNVSATAIEQIIATQADPKTREAVADDILDNNGDLNNLYARIDVLHKQYVEQAQQKLTATSAPSADTTTERPMTEAIAAEPVITNTANPARECDITHATLFAEQQAENKIIYELPLNERVRILMRLEGLFEEFDLHAGANSVWNSRAAIKILLALQSALNRPDIKTELIKEIDRLHNVLKKFEEMPNVDSTRLSCTREELAAMSKTLRAHSGQFGQELKQNELIVSVRQRETIPGGPSTFDIPCYGFWLNRPLPQRQKDLKNWIREFDLLREATTLILRIVRDSGTPSAETAANGTFQLIMDQTQTYQLIRVLLPMDSEVCAEISGGRHRFGIRFVKPQTESRPVPATENIAFQLSCCAI